MREILLTQGFVAMVDDEDYPTLAAHKWYANRRRTSFYAVRNVLLPQGKRPILMHRVLLGDPAGHVDHINGDGLDNRQSNLRLATSAQNGMNQRSQARKASQYKGVYWRADALVWQVQIHIDGKNTYVGIFHDEEAAGHAYDERARKAFGEFAALNFPKPGEQSAHRISTIGAA